MIVDDRIRDLVDAEVSTIHLPALDAIADIGQVATKRKRRRTGLGGLATLFVMFGLIAVVGPRFGEPTSDVFAGTSNPEAMPANVLAMEDGTYVGLALSDPFDRDELGNLQTVVVTSKDARNWTPVGTTLTLGNSGAQLTTRDGVVHLVSVRQVAEAAATADAEAVAQLVHATSTDLVNWQERTYNSPAAFDRPGQSYVLSDVVATRDGVVALFDGFPTRQAFDDFMENNYDSMCGFGGESAGVSYRLCGEDDFVKIPLNQGPFSSGADTVLVMIDDDGARELETPAEPGNGFRVSGSSTIFETTEGFGFVGYQVHETSNNGGSWDYVSVGSDRNLLVAGRGDERVMKTQSRVVMMTNDGPQDEPGSLGMAYSRDAGETWQRVDISHIFDADDLENRMFDNLTVGQAGWALTTNSWSEPTAFGDQAIDERFTLTSEGFVLEAVLPFGAAELRDPDGTVVRSWERFEPSNPVWSGLSITNGDIVIAHPSSGELLVAFSMEQWQGSLPASPSNGSDVLFSPDGRNWSLVDTSSAMTRVLAIGNEELLVHRFFPGLWSQFVPQVEVISLEPES